MADSLLPLDLTGLRCPLPVLRLEAKARQLPAQTILEVRADDPIARLDIPHAMRKAGHLCEEITAPTEDNPVCVFKVTIAS